MNFGRSQTKRVAPGDRQHLLGRVHCKYVSVPKLEECLSEPADTATVNGPLLYVILDLRCRISILCQT